jgi:DNA-binding SARP family transcriptional activator/streptogramin lyase
MEEEAVALVRILGPLDVVADGRPISVGGDRQRLLLGVLALRASHVVTTDELVEALFRRGGSGALHTAISRLRNSLGADWIETHPSGYALRADAERLDAARAIEAATRANQARDPGERAKALRAAEGFWRGPVLAGMDVPASFRADVDRLEELRKSIVADRIETELALGRHADLVGDLEPLTRANPFDERLHRARALALHRSGRQADALSALTEYHSRLREELGLEPSATLRELERGILNHDPALLPPEPAATAEARAPSRRRVPVWAATVAMTAVVVGAALVAMVRTGSGRVPLTELRPGTLAEVPFEADGAERTFEIGRMPRALAVGDGAAWVADFTDQTVTRLDEDGTPETIGLGVSATGIDVGDEATWLIAGDEGWLIRLETSTGRVLDRIRLRPGLTDVAADAESVWVTNAEAGTLTRVDATRSRPIRTFSGFARPTGVVASAGSVWVAERLGRRLLRLDARREIIMARIPLDLPPLDLAVAAGAVWATNHGAGAVTRVDIRTREARVISVGRFPTTVAAAQDSVFVLNEFDHSISRLHARSGETIQTLSLSDPITQQPSQITPGDIAADDGALWLTVRSY